MIALFFFLFSQFSAADELAQDKLLEMSLEEKIGQLFVFGIRGTSVNKKLTRHLEKIRPGGIILFGHNIQSTSQLMKLNSDLKKIYKSVPPFIAVDQEGGSVSRIRINPPFPSAMAIGASGKFELSERIGYLTGETLKALGFNMNLAPVMDIADPFKKSFIGNRAFGGNPHQVAEMAVSYSKGLMMAGVLPTAKHFPGHGGTTLDSHKVLPKRNLALTTLLENDIVPFKSYAALPGMSAMMMAHVSFPKIDPSHAPASFSSAIMQTLLRERVGYRGLVITDDFDMQAIQGNKEKYFDKVVKSLNAGADIVMMAWSQRQQRRAIKEIMKAVESGRLTEKLIDEKVSRILKAKEEYLSYDRNYSLAEVDKIMNSRFIKDSFYQITKKNMSQQAHMIRGKLRKSELPQIVSGSYRFNSSFHKVFKSRLPTITIRKKTTIEELKQNWIRNRLTVFYVSGPRSASLANQLPRNYKKNTLIVSVTEPAHIRNPDEFSGIVNLYSPHPKLGSLVAKEIKKRPSVAKQ